MMFHSWPNPWLLLSCYGTILMYQDFTQRARAMWIWVILKMFLCLIMGCGNKRGWTVLCKSAIDCYKLIKREETRKLAKERWPWLARMTSQIFEHDWVCAKHFVPRSASRSWDRFNIDWVRSFWATMTRLIIQIKIRSSERASEWWKQKKSAFAEWVN